MTIDELLEQELRRRMDEEKAHKPIEMEDEKFPGKYIVEGLRGGIRVMVHKNKDEVRIFSNEGDDVTALFKANKMYSVLFTKSLVELSVKDYVIDCELSSNKNKEKVAYVLDVLYHGHDLTNDPWYNRKVELRGLNYTSFVKESPSVVVNSADELKKAIRLFKGLYKDKCTLNIIKYNDKYCKTGMDESLIEYSVV